MSVYSFKITKGKYILSLSTSDKELVEEQFSVDLSEYSDRWGIDLDIPKLLVGKVGKSLGRDDAERETRVKMILNGSVMKKCTYKMIKDMENETEIRKWFEAIREITQS